jgi:hypothetical protein
MLVVRRAEMPAAQHQDHRVVALVLTEAAGDAILV